MRKKIIIFLILIFIVPCYKISALTYGGCEYSQISRLKSIVQNINVSYKYKIINGEVYYDVIISNLIPQIYVSDLVYNNNYYDNVGDLIIENIQARKISYSFYSALEGCYGVSLGKKYLTFPIYNNYYNSDICSGMKDFSLCQKWAKVNYDYDKLSKLIDDYKNKSKEIEYEDIKIEKSFFDKLVEFYTKYYYFILLPIIFIFGIIVIIKRKNEKFKI